MHKQPTMKTTAEQVARTALAVEAHRLAMWLDAPPYLPDTAVVVLPAPGPGR